MCNLYYDINTVVQNGKGEFMSWELKNDRPVYIQLIEEIQLRIVSGTYKSGTQLPSVRELAAEAAVNPNTMQKALSELERGGLVYSRRTSGRFITENIQLIKSTRKNLANSQIEDFIQKMKNLGFESDEIIFALSEKFDGKRKDN